VHARLLAVVDAQMHVGQTREHVRELVLIGDGEWRRRLDV
jgi:hypothetical protein